MRQVSLPGRRPFLSAGISPARTSDDLPEPEAPTTARNRVDELFQQALDVGVAPEEELRVVLVEGLQAPVRADIGRGLDLRWRAVRYAFDGIDEWLEVASILVARAEIDPGVRRENGWQIGRVERLWQAGQENKEEAVGAILGGPVLGELQLLARPVADAVRPDEDGAGRGLLEDSLGDFLLPATARCQMPGVQPRLDAGLAQLDRDPLDGRLVLGVVGQKDVIASRWFLGIAHDPGRFLTVSEILTPI